MAQQIQILRSSVPGKRPGPATQPVGSLYLNMPDRVLGFIDADGTPVDLTLGGVSGVLGGAMKIADGTMANVVLPDYQKLVVEDLITVADGAVLENGGIRISPDGGGTAIIEARCNVKNSYGEFVVFGYSVDGALPPVEIGRAQCNSNDFVFAIIRRNAVIAPGSLIEFYISSTFEWDGFVWTGCEMQIVYPQDQPEA